MPVNRKHHATDTATAARWRLLGRLLFKRRVELGYRYRPAFAEARLPRTAQGNLMIRAVNAIENGERPGTYTDGTMAMYARAYEVTEESVYAVLEGSADKLDPAPAWPAAVIPAAAPPLPPPPPGSEIVREAPVRPYATPMWEALWRLAARGVLDPSGARLAAEVEADPDPRQRFRMTPEDISAWDGSRGAMSLADRAWAAGEMRRRRETWNAARQQDASSA